MAEKIGASLVFPGIASVFGCGVILRPEFTFFVGVPFGRYLFPIVFTTGSAIGLLSLPQARKLPNFGPSKLWPLFALAHLGNIGVQLYAMNCVRQTPELPLFLSMTDSEAHYRQSVANWVEKTQAQRNQRLVSNDSSSSSSSSSPPSSRLTSSDSDFSLDMNKSQ